MGARVEAYIFSHMSSIRDLMANFFFNHVWFIQDWEISGEILDLEFEVTEEDFPFQIPHFSAATFPLHGL